jgi:predicted double-glycine peptidase
VVFVVGVTIGLLAPSQVVAQPSLKLDRADLWQSPAAAILALRAEISQLQAKLDSLATPITAVGPHQVPYYSQFADISSPAWQKVGCGIASTAMIIDFYSDEPIHVDSLLQTGISNRAYLDTAGWIHAGLINLTKAYGLDGSSHSLQHQSMTEAFKHLREVVAGGPVMVSVHYTFQPTNPIPHLAVVTGIDDERVYYNDPAEPGANNSISIEQFKSAWKKRYIEIRPV